MRQALMKTTHSTAEQQLINQAVEALISTNVATQNRGVKQLIQLGTLAVPDLLTLYKDKKRQVNHTQVMFVLSQIADEGATDIFIAGLNHSDERVRAYAAQGLVRTRHPDAMRACLQTLNDSADELHLDITPSVIALAGMGQKAVPALLNLMSDSDEMTRLRAQRALELFINLRHGFSIGRGFPSAEAEEAAHGEWVAHGDYDYCADEASRTAAITKWQQWLESVKE
jgi:HEAT repeat protein